MNARLTAVAAAFALAALPPVVRASSPILLRMAVSAPATSPVTVHGTMPWVRQVNKDSGGTIRIKVFPGGRLSNEKEMLDRLVKGVFEVCYGNQGAISGQFPGTEVSALPFLANNSTDASEALWMLANGGPIASEYKDVKLLAVFAYPPVILHFRKPVKSLQDLKGLKVSAMNRVISESLQALGAVPISMSNTDIYQAASRGVIDGIAMPWTGVRQFKIHEVTRYHLEVPIGAADGFVAMNKETFDRLPEKAKRAIDKDSGMALVRHYGQVLDHILGLQRKFVGGLPGHTIAQLTPAEKVRWMQRLKPVLDKWTHQVKNGPAILSAYESALKKVEAQ